MTYEKREEMFSKDYLTIEDIEELLGVGYQVAARIIRNIRRKTDRLGTLGKIHVQDYLDYFNLKPDRYVAQKPEENKEEEK